MSKSILFALLTVTGATLNAGETFACGGRYGASVTNCAAPSCGTAACPAPANAAATNAAAADPHAGMRMSQSNTSSTYQSFSYEPGASQSMISQPTISSPVQNVAPAYRTYRQPSPSSSFYDSVRGDKKVRAAGGIH